MNKRKLISETKAIVFIVLTVLLVKVTVLEAYIVPTGSMENTIMTGDFLIGSRFVYGMRTPDWIGIPYTDIGFFIPYIKFPEFKIPTTGDVLIFKYPRDKYVKYVKRCVAGPGDTLIVQQKKLYVNGVEIPMWENGKYLTAPMQKNFRQSDIFLSSKTNINKDNIGPIYVPKSGDVFQIDEETNWRFLLPIILMEGHTATLKSNEVEYEFTLQDPNELFRRKGKDDVYENYFPKGPLLTPWSKAIKDEDFQFLVIDGIPASEWTKYKVSQNYYWAMGDNRDNSLDSRYWGYIPENNILGEALFTYFSLDLDSWTPRWGRIGTVLR
ncbi:MAG: signal peptidase I [Candidatus Marinimicrobia bacterium]|nr:signal peptidase I [Candidatus Neomarinimicrobiota bacterium]MBT4661029.1 signal peptidase I [Candidatus Neomarinimicrobiota bacterium]